MDPKKGPTQAAKDGAAAATAAELRREKRLHVAVPVKVFASATSPESQTCCTYEISAVGARLVAPPGSNKLGQIIWLQRNNRRAKYKVVWIGEPGSSQAGQVGVETLEPQNVIWGDEIRARITQS